MIDIDEQSGSFKVVRCPRGRNRGSVKDRKNVERMIKGSKLDGK
jgi:hypothetical protein